MSLGIRGDGASGAPYVVASGTDTYTASYGSYAGYVLGDSFEVLFTNANTGASTININSLGAKALKKNGTVALDAGDIQAGSVKILTYDGTNFQITAVGTVNTTGTPSAGQMAGFTDADTIQGITLGANILLTGTTLNAHFQSENMVDANYVFSAGKTMVALTTALSTTRTLTLPAANSFPKGTAICFSDEIQGVTNTNNVTITRAGADTVNGSTTMAIYLTGAVAIFVTDGSSKWLGGVSTSASNGILGTWVPTFTGFSADPTAVTAIYLTVGKLVWFSVNMTGGTSNAATMSMTGPPITFVSTHAQASMQRVQNNGTWAAGLMYTTVNTNTLNFLSSASAAFTNSGTKSVNITETLAIN